MCGGSGVVGGVADFVHGLSPRVRGKLAYQPGAKVFRRSIPACAGEATKRWALVYLPLVYPRVCGGSFGAFARTRPVAGLSPRVRGKL